MIRGCCRMKPFVFLFLVIVQTCVAPPVTQNKKDTHEGQEADSEIGGLEDYMEYHRYLKEVVNALESDPDFRKKLETADESVIKSGKIADELEFVSHHVRTRLDEIKRVELERLKELAEKKKRLEDPNSIDEDPAHHLDHSNPHTFEIEDLKKLIAKTTADLAEVDKRRREQFKQYELEKEYQKREKVNHTNGAEREKIEKEYQELEEKHKKHEKLHEPGHKAQLEEVWEKQDEMQQDFDPKTFFLLHDLDGNGLWDQNEVKALFIKELDKMYQEGAPEDDMRERIEEMERMRESVFKEMDTNHDGFIDYNEFWAQTNSKAFNQDHGWQSIDEQRPYTDEELAEYVRLHEAASRAYQVHPNAYPIQGNYQQGPPAGYYQVPPSGYQAAPQGVPQGGYQQVPPAGYQHPPQGYQPPSGGYQPVPPGSQQVPQVPSGGYHPNAVPPQGQVQNGQVPQNAAHVQELNTNEIHSQQAYPQPSQNQQPQPPNYQHQAQPPMPNPPQVQQHEQTYQQQQVNQQVNQQPQHQPVVQQANQQPPQQVNQQPQQINQQQQQQPQPNQQQNNIPPHAA